MTQPQIDRQLVVEASRLYQKLNDQAWKYVMQSDLDKYAKIDWLRDKALERYERRYKKYAGLP